MTQLEKPDCKCHDYPMYWAKDATRQAGGRWRCTIKTRQQQKKYPERNRKRATQWREKNPERSRENARKRTERWRKRNPEKTLEKAQKWRESHPGKHVEAVRRWQAANPDKLQKYTRTRRARKVGAESDGHTRNEVFERDGGICQICFVPLGQDWHEDHVVPLSRGGSDLISNVQATCPPCNRRKGARLVADSDEAP